MSNIIRFNSPFEDYGFRVEKSDKISVFSFKTGKERLLAPNPRGGYIFSVQGSPRQKTAADVRRMVKEADKGAAQNPRGSFIVYSTKVGVSQMFTGSTTMDEVVALFEKRNIQLDNSFMVVYPDLRMFKRVKVRPAKVVISFE